MLKHVVVWQHTYFLVPLYVITNQTIDTIKAIGLMVNLKLRKLKKNNVRNTEKNLTT